MTDRPHESGAGEVRVADNPEEQRFEAWLGDQRAGAAYYRRSNGRVIFTHTEVDDAYEGQGIGSKLARTALDSARAEGATVVPHCPFIDSYIRRHPEYADLVQSD